VRLKEAVTLLAFFLLVIPNITTNKKPMKREIPFNSMAIIAATVEAALRPFCTRFDFAGSYRRQCPILGDLEVCAILPRANRTKAGMALMQIATIVKGTLQGDARYVQLVMKETGIQLDIFLPAEDDYFRQLAIRTGSAIFSHSLARRWAFMGWVGTNDGLRRKSECIETKSGWVHTGDIITRPPVWDSEEAFFEWLEMAYRQPNERM
jgi:DNA polymerase/3'-5' exonuclease PolX